MCFLTINCIIVSTIICRCLNHHSTFPNNNKHHLYAPLTMGLLPHLSVLRNHCSEMMEKKQTVQIHTLIFLKAICLILPKPRPLTLLILQSPQATLTLLFPFQVQLICLQVALYTIHPAQFTTSMEILVRTTYQAME